MKPGPAPADLHRIPDATPAWGFWDTCSDRSIELGFDILRLYRHREYPMTSTTQVADLLPMDGRSTVLSSANDIGRTREGA
jgi:hypothetical protein